MKKRIKMSRESWKALKDSIDCLLESKKTLGVNVGDWIVIPTDRILKKPLTIREAFALVENIARHEFAHILYDGLMKSSKLNEDLYMQDTEDFALRMELVYGLRNFMEDVEKEKE